MNKIYTVFDKDAKMADLSLFNVPTDEVAKRVIGNSLENDKNLRKHASSYTLICLGIYDRETGITKTEFRTVCEIKELLGMAEPAPQAPLAE